MRSLTRDEFQDALKKGLGRAVQHVRNSPPEAVREDLLHACLNSLAYDRQSEGSRAPWLFFMLELTEDLDYYVPRIFEQHFNLVQDRIKNDNQYQLFGLVCKLAEYGSEKAKAEVYRFFDSQFNEDYDGWFYGWSTIIAIDKIPGLLHILERFGHFCSQYLKDNGDDSFEDGLGYMLYIIECAEEQLGKEEVQTVLKEKKEQSEFIKICFEHAKAYQERHDARELERQNETKEQFQERKREEYPLRDYVDSLLADDFSQFKEDKQYVEDPYHFLLRKQRFSWAGRWAKEEDINYALDKILLTEDPLRQTILLRTFYNRPLPRVEKQLLDMLDSENEYLTWAIGIVLSEISHPLIREKALETLKSDPPKKDWLYGIIWAQNSFLGEDVKLLKTLLLTKTIPEDADLETVGHSLRDIYKRFPGDHFKAIFLWLYEHGPCSFCREQIVETLIENHWCPPEILEECRNDCNSDIRELVEKQLTSKVMTP